MGGQALCHLDLNLLDTFELSHPASSDGHKALPSGASIAEPRQCVC